MIEGIHDKVMDNFVHTVCQIIKQTVIKLYIVPEKVKGQSDKFALTICCGLKNDDTMSIIIK